MRRVLVTIIAVAKQHVLHIVRVFVALVIQHAMRCAILLSVTCPALYSILPNFLIECILEEKKII